MKRIFTAIILSTTILNSWAQSAVSYTLNTQISITSSYTARDFVKMNAGFKFSSNGTTTYKAKTDESLIFDAVYADFLGETDLVTDKNLPVGSANGSLNVSASGGAIYNIPIVVAPGTNNMIPNLSVVYNSQGGIGLLGKGWDLSGISAITRVGKTIIQDGAVHGVDLSTDDRFALDGNRLNVTNSGTYGAEGTIYGTEIESFVKVTSHETDASVSGPEWFEVVTDDGSVIEYGKNGSSFIVNNKNILWKINKITDRFGNYMTFTYNTIDNEHLITSISYTGNTMAPYNKVEFFYVDKYYSRDFYYQGGEKFNQKHLLRKIKITTEGNQTMAYEFNYSRKDIAFLKQIIEYGAENEYYNSTKIVYEGLTKNYENEFSLYTLNHLGNLIQNRYVGDFNGDGKQDFVLTFQSGYTLSLSNGLNSSFSFVNPESSLRFIPRHVSVFDFDRDGTDEFFIINKETNIAKLLEYNDGVIIDLYNDIQLESNQIIQCFDINGNGDAESITLDYDGNIISIGGMTFGTLPQCEPDEKYFNDFNGNGKVDLFYRSNNGTVSVYEYNKNSGQFDEIANKAVLPENATPDIELFGDYNGDGYVDYIFEYNKQLYCYLFNGAGFDREFGGADLMDYYLTVESTQSELFLEDIDGNGKSELIKYFISPDNIPTIYIWSNMHILADIVISSTDIPSLLYAKPLDVNGDGKSDFLTYSTNFEKVLTFFPPEFNYLASHIQDGIGNNTKITHASIANDNTVYEKGSYQPQGVVKVFQKPLYVVKSIEAPNGIGGTATTTYKYTGALLHSQGKGFLGFKSFASSNSATDLKITTTNNWETVNYFISSTNTKQEFLSTGQQISSATQNYGFVTLSSVTGKKRFFHYLDTQTETQSLTGVTNTYDYSYYADNRLKDKTIMYNGSSTNQEKTTYTYTSVTVNGKSLKVVNTESLQKTLNAETFTKTTTNNAFNSFGLPILITDFRENITHLSYDGFGNVTHSDINGSKSVDFTYDTKGRFQESKKYNNDAAQTEYYTYDSRTGNILTSKTINGLTTFYEYDGFGRLKSTTTPEGHTITDQINWDTNTGDLIHYYTTRTIPGRPTEWVYYDVLGREIKSVTQGLGSNLVTVEKSYLADGKLEKESLPYLTGEQKRWTNYSYKPNDGRVQNVSVNGISTSYGYSGLTTTVTKPDGQQYAKTYDASGLLLSASDPGGTITYGYHPSGQVDEMVYNNGKTITIGYDAYMNQDYLNDPDAGYMDYTYNALGELTSMTDPNQNSTGYHYDALGRVDQKQITDNSKGTTLNYTVDYEYFPSGTGINQLKKVTYSEIGIYQEFTYDDFGRVKTAREVIPNESSLTKTYSYDAYGNETGVVYDAESDGTTDFSITQEYDKGILKKVLYGSTALWEGLTTNAMGQFKTTKVGTENVTKTYDTHNYLSSIAYSGTGGSTLSYVFDPITGNLSERHDSYSNIREYFGYDELNRLTDITYGTTIQNMTYSPNGNINTKTHAGYYKYDTNREGAVEYVSTDALPNDEVPTEGLTLLTLNPTIPTDVSTTAQNISYTWDHNPRNITEGLHQYDFTYGPGGDRKKMTYKNNGSLRSTTYYHGNYEKEVDNVTGLIKRTFYVAGADGLAALAVINNGALTRYYVHTDHLGSVIALRNSTHGYIDAYYSYDAWGRRRNHSTYTYTGFTVSTLTRRGYTGHEHLDNVSLINMNGRLYDPILGRMLSPDNNVQLPDFSQNLNRYSYALNNPLVYTDPDGEWFGIDDAISAGFGFIVGYASYGLTTGNWGWKAVGAGGIGAAVAWLGWNTMGAGLAALPGAGAGSATSFSAGMTAVFGSASGSYGVQFAAFTALNVIPNSGEINKADEKGWNGVWAMGGYMAGSVLSTSLKPLSIGAKQAGLGLRQFVGVSLTNNLSDNMENGFFNFHSVHVGPVGWDAERHKNNHSDGWGGFYTIGSPGLTGDQRFGMGFETVLGLSLVKSDIYLPKRIQPITGGDAYWKTANCYRNAYKFGHTIVRTSQIGAWSRNILQASDIYFMLRYQKTTYQYWYDSRFNEDGTLNGR